MFNNTQGDNANNSQQSGGMFRGINPNTIFNESGGSNSGTFQSFNNLNTHSSSMDFFGNISGGTQPDGFNNGSNNAQNVISSGFFKITTNPNT